MQTLVNKKSFFSLIFEKYDFNNRLKFDKYLLLRIVICVFIVGFLTYAYAFFNNILNFDGLAWINQENDIELKLSLGRFMQPLNFLFRGYIVAPWLLGFLSLFWLSLSLYFIIKIMNITNNIFIYILCSLFVTSRALISTFGSFYHEVDSFMLALLFAVLCVYIFEKYKFGFIFSAFLVIISCGFYQMYFSVITMMFLILLIKNILIDDYSIKRIIIKGIKSLFSMIIGLLMYNLVYTSIINIFNVPLNTGYNNISNVFSFSDFNIIQTEITSIYRFFQYSLLYTVNNMNVNEFRDFIINLIINIVLFISIAIYLILILKRKKLGFVKNIFVVFLTLLMPSAVSIVFFISKNQAIHELGTYSFVTFYLFLFVLISIYHSVKKNVNINVKVKSTKNIYLKIIMCLMIIISFKNIIFANNLFLERNLRAESTLSVMTRIIDEIEHTEGYVMGETEVYFAADNAVGYWNINNTNRDGFEHINSIGTRGELSLIEKRDLYTYLDSILAYNINVIKDNTDTANKLDENEDVQNMPVFPEEGYCQFVDDVLVVKLSEVSD